jgi:hypothetical protein
MLFNDNMNPGTDLSKYYGPQHRHKPFGGKTSPAKVPLAKYSRAKSSGAKSFNGRIQNTAPRANNGYPLGSGEWTGASEGQAGKAQQTSKRGPEGKYGDSLVYLVNCHRNSLLAEVGRYSPESRTRCVRSFPTDRQPCNKQSRSSLDEAQDRIVQAVPERLPVPSRLPLCSCNER